MCSIFTIEDGMIGAFVICGDDRFPLAAEVTVAVRVPMGQSIHRGCVLSRLRPMF